MCCTCISRCLASSLHLTIGAPLLPQGTRDPAAEEQALGGRGGFSSLSDLGVSPSLPRPRNPWFLSQRPTSPAQPGEVGGGGRLCCRRGQRTLPAHQGVGASAAAGLAMAPLLPQAGASAAAGRRVLVCCPTRG